MNCCFCDYGSNLCHTKKIHWGEFLTFVYSLDPPHHRKSNQNWRELAFCARGVSFSLGDQSPSVCFWNFSHERYGFYLETDFCWCVYCVHFPPGLSFAQVHGNDLDAKSLWILLDLDLILPSSSV